ncbi:hypothetical protein [Chryseobacterium sp. A321]
MGFSDGPIEYVGGAGDPLGIFEVGGMALSSSDCNLPLLVVKGQEDDALKLLTAAKGSLTGTRGALTEAKSMIGLQASETLPKVGTGKFEALKEELVLKDIDLIQPIQMRNLVLVKSFRTLIIGITQEEREGKVELALLSQ